MIFFYPITVNQKKQAKREEAKKKMQANSFISFSFINNQSLKLK